MLTNNKHLQHTQGWIITSKVCVNSQTFFFARAGNQTAHLHWASVASWLDFLSPSASQIWQWKGNRMWVHFESEPSSIWTGRKCQGDAPLPGLTARLGCDKTDEANLRILFSDPLSFLQHPPPFFYPPPQPPRAALRKVAANTESNCVDGAGD